MGRDPGTGDVLLATHQGLYVYEDGEPNRVGPVIDLMGFTVAGPGHYYASGHPGAGVDLPQPVGLIETRDGGRTWKVLSRGGASDFHALTTAGERVAGFDGSLRTSSDGQSWTAGNLSPEPRSLAGSNDDDTLLATTADGLKRSTDGGASWRPVAGAPLLLLVAWADGRTVVGLTPQGRVHVSGDAGLTWLATELEAAQPQALHAAGAGQELLIVVATDANLLVSRRGGRFAPWA
jgi:hypothetical protein